jgi:hypothetical protein
MQHVKEIGTVVAAHPPVPERPAAVGFTPQAARTTFFRMGTLYAEALAALHGGAVEAAASRLDVLLQALASVQAPRPLSQYLREMQTLIQRQQYEDKELATFLALFEPLYEEEYTRQNMAEALLLFRVGTWVENMFLAAAVGDPAAVQRGGQAAAEVRHALAQVHAPPAVLDALERLHRLVVHPTLTEQDLRAIRTLVQDIQGMLSA